MCDIDLLQSTVKTLLNVSLPILVANLLLIFNFQCISSITFSSICTTPHLHAFPFSYFNTIALFAKLALTSFELDIILCTDYRIHLALIRHCSLALMPYNIFKSNNILSLLSTAFEFKISTSPSNSI